jgi:hypothetical protein
LGRQSAARFERSHTDDPTAVLNTWKRYQAWHPTRGLFGLEASGERLAELEVQAHQQQGMQLLADLRRQAADPDADAEAIWEKFRAPRAMPSTSAWP